MAVGRPSIEPVAAAPGSGAMKLRGGRSFIVDRLGDSICLYEISRYPG
jgi:hypothetical protein